MTPVGLKNSTLTRVEPVFRAIADAGDPGWLARLLRLPLFGNTLALPPTVDLQLMVPPCFGTSEKTLPPPVGLLSWLIRHPEVLRSRPAASDTTMPLARRELISGDHARGLEAMQLLRSGVMNGWHIFEGDTQPDVYIETPDVIVVIEGKRTELGPTRETKWMPSRHQMIRHLDCAWEQRGTKALVGFFIVEGDGGSANVPGQWQQFSRATISPRVIAASLPHRGPEEQRQIAQCFLGITTWQRVCQEFGIAYETSPRAVPDQP